MDKKETLEHFLERLDKPYPIVPELMDRIKEIILSGESVYITMPKGHGRTAFKQAINHYLDEIQLLELKTVLNNDIEFERLVDIFHPHEKARKCYEALTELAAKGVDTKNIKTIRTLNAYYGTYILMKEAPTCQNPNSKTE